MSSDNFDNEVTNLFKQRKAQVIAPQINLGDKPAAHRWSPLSLVAIFSVAGITSFGIMAIISNLSNSPEMTTPSYDVNHHVDIAEVEPIEEVKKIIAVIPPLPPKPMLKMPNKPSVLDVDHVANKNIIQPDNLTAVLVPSPSLPQLKEPKFTIKPIFKVLPKYSENLLQTNQSGEIQLKYQITPGGEVKNITIVQSSVSRKLQQSAKRALAKWRYKPNQNFEDNYDVIFEFRVDDNKP